LILVTHITQISMQNSRLKNLHVWCETAYSKSQNSQQDCEEDPKLLGSSRQFPQDQCL